MASFKDAAGREWFIKMTIGKAAKLKDQFNLDFVAALYDVDKSYKIIGELYRDLARFSQVIHMAAEVSTPFEEFADGLGGEEIAAAFEALDQAFTDFHPPAKREKIAMVKTEMKAALEAGSQDLMPEIREKIQKEIRGAVRKMSGMTSISGG